MTAFTNLCRIPAKFILAGALALAGPSVAFAQQEISPEHLQVARTYVDMTDNAAVYERSLVDIGVSVLRLLIQQDPALADPAQEAITTVYDEYAKNKGELYNQFARIYANRFSVEELQQIVTFYSSDVGKKLLENNAGVNNDMQTVLRVWAGNAQTEFLSKVRTVLREKGFNA